MAITVNTFGNCTTDQAGSGKAPCEVDLGLLKGFILVKRGWNLDIASGSFTETIYKGLVKDGTFFPYTGLFNFEQNNEDNVTETAPNTGAISIIRSGLPSFNFIFNNSDCFHKGLYDKQGNKNYDVILAYEKGLKLVEKNGKIKGFGTNSISVASFTEKTAESAKSTVTIQLDSAEDYNRNFVSLSYTSDLGFDVNDINGVIETKLIIGANTATSIPVKVVCACNSSTEISGMDEVANWKVINTATSEELTITVTETAGGNYTLEGTGLPTTGFQVILNGEDALGNMYKGKTTK